MGPLFVAQRTSNQRRKNASETGTSTKLTRGYSSSAHIHPQSQFPRRPTSMAKLANSMPSWTPTRGDLFGSYPLAHFFILTFIRTTSKRSFELSSGQVPPSSCHAPRRRTRLSQTKSSRRPPNGPWGSSTTSSLNLPSSAIQVPEHSSHMAVLTQRLKVSKPM